MPETKKPADCEAAFNRWASHEGRPDITPAGGGDHTAALCKHVAEIAYCAGYARANSHVARLEALLQATVEKLPLTQEYNNLRERICAVLQETARDSA